MNETTVILASRGDVEQDASANRAIRGVASTPSSQHIIPAEIVAFLYEQVDLMRAELFDGKVPEVVLSFDVTDRRTLGHYHLRRKRSRCPVGAQPQPHPPRPAGLRGPCDPAARADPRLAA